MSKVENVCYASRKVDRQLKSSVSATIRKIRRTRIAWGLSLVTSFLQQTRCFLETCLLVKWSLLSEERSWRFLTESCHMSKKNGPLSTAIWTCKELKWVNLKSSTAFTTYLIFKVIVNNPLPKKKTSSKADSFQDTMVLIDIYRHKMELAKYEKRVRLQLSINPLKHFI